MHFDSFAGTIQLGGSGVTKPKHSAPAPAKKRSRRRSVREPIRFGAGLEGGKPGLRPPPKVQKKHEWVDGTVMWSPELGRMVIKRPDGSIYDVGFGGESNDTIHQK
jgi:hypothetical protein